MSVEEGAQYTAQIGPGPMGGPKKLTPRWPKKRQAKAGANKVSTRR
jgi:hypothetical protein